MIHHFDDKLAFSRGGRESSDLETIQRMIDGCVRVEKTDEATDRLGVDYVAYLRRGSEILIDAKARQAGCSRFWRYGPELALEVWSVMPSGRYHTPLSRAKVGWTLCERKATDLILFTFDQSDACDVYLVSFQLLRMAFRRNVHDWAKRYKVDVQDSGRWESQAIFVPATTVMDAMTEVMRGQIAA